MLAELKKKEAAEGDLEACQVAAPQKATVELVPQPPKTVVSVALHGDHGHMHGDTLLHARYGGSALADADPEEGAEEEMEQLIQVGPTSSAHIYIKDEVFLDHFWPQSRHIVDENVFHYRCCICMCFDSPVSILSKRLAAALMADSSEFA